MSDSNIEPEQPEVPRGFWGELRDSVSIRTFALILGVLFLQLGFILSYVGAFHAPKPHRIPIGIVAPATASAHLVAELDGIPSEPLHASPLTDEATARGQILDDSTDAALVINPRGKRDRLLVATAAGVSEVTAVEAVVDNVEAGQHRTVSVTDLVPMQSGDGRGLSGFYLVIGWIVGGYLVAALLGVSKGAQPATTRRAIFRLLAVVPYAILSGLGGAIVVGPLLGALTGHLIGLWCLGTLLVLSSATVTVAFQVLFGVLGIGVTVLVFVILGNPSAGGAYQPALLPPFWRAISRALPNGAGTDIVRRIVYFGAHGITGELLVISAYVVGGVVVALVGSTRLQRRAAAAVAPSETSPAPA